MFLRARWTGDLPQVGDWLASPSRPRYGYRIEKIIVAGLGKLKLGVERVPAAEVPWDSATVHAWRWDPRKRKTE